MKTSAMMLMLAACASGQGKTTVCAALARHLRAAGKTVRVFKVGADFIDPLILEYASASSVEVLDSWMVGLPLSRQMLAEAANEVDVVLVEGVMGLYDGQPSCADLARALDLPVLLVLDGAAMAQTAGALVLGLREYGPIRLAGVIANRVSHPAHAQMIADSLRDCPLLGYLPAQAQSLPERHLGLVLPQEVAQLEQILQNLGQGLQLDMTAWESLPVLPLQQTAIAPPKQLLAGKTIAVARDAAFAFLYPANLTCLQAMGARLSFFSPLANQAVPNDADAIYLPGGYPELHAATLQEAQLWQASLRAAHLANLPIWAECGGMMALCRELHDVSGAVWKMAGILPASVRMQSGIAALGPQSWPHSSGELRGHTFHFSTIQSDLKPISVCRRHPSLADGEAVYSLGSLHASYFHAYFPSAPATVAAIFSGKG